MNEVREELEFNRWFDKRARESFAAAYGPNVPFRSGWSSGFWRVMKEAWMARARLQSPTSEKQP